MNVIAKAKDIFTSRAAARALKRMPFKAFNHNYHFMPEFGLVYVAIPKVGCSTMKSTFFSLYNGKASGGHKGIHNVERQPWKHVSDYGLGGALDLLQQRKLKTVAFVRNPYVRVLSCYLNQFEKLDNRPHKEGKTRRREKLLGDPLKEPTFQEFVDAIGRQTTYEMNGHWRPQTEQLLWGEIEYDLIGRLENFNADFDRLGELIGRDLRPFLTPSTHATGASARVGEFYTPEIAEKVRRIYAADFEHLGYGTELP